MVVFQMVVVLTQRAQTDKSVSRIDEDGIGKFVTDFIGQK
jgi:hypothetical protein